MSDHDDDDLGGDLIGDQADDDLNEDIPNLKKALLNERVRKSCLSAVQLFDCWLCA